MIVFGRVAEPKITIIVPFVYMARDGNDFDGGKSISRAIGRGGPKSVSLPLPRLLYRTIEINSDMAYSVICLWRDSWLNSILVSGGVCV